MAVEDVGLIGQNSERDDSYDKKEERVANKKFKEFHDDLSDSILNNGHLLVSISEEGEYFDNCDSA